MANYSVLKAAVQAVVKTNGNQEITGANMQSTLISIINSLGTGYQFMGVATPSTSPGSPDYNVAYIGGAGTYANFGTSVTVPVGSICVFKYNGSWTNQTISIYTLDNFPTKDSTNLVPSGVVYDEVQKIDNELGIINFPTFANSCITAFGVISGLAGATRSDYIDVTGLEYIYASNPNNSILEHNVFYDTDKVFITNSRFIIAANAVYQKIPVPTGAKYCIVSARNNGIIPKLYTDTSLIIDIDNIGKAVDEIVNGTIEKNKLVNTVAASSRVGYLYEIKDINASYHVELDSAGDFNMIVAILNGAGFTLGYNVHEVYLGRPVNTAIDIIMEDEYKATAKYIGIFVGSANLQKSFTIKWFGFLDSLDYLQTGINHLNDRVFGTDTTPIVYLNDRILTRNKIENAKRIPRSGNTQASVTPLMLLHFSDIHHSQANLQRIKDFYDYYKKDIDDVISTGDMVSLMTDGMEFWDACDAENFMMVIGNHETYNSSSTDPATPSAVYNMFIKPYVSNWNVTQPSNAEANALCYYYKDYTAAKVRLIVLDDYEKGVTDYITNQNTWFAARLDEARLAGLSVLVAIHPVAGGQTGFNCVFNAYQKGYNVADIQSVFKESVNSFITAGGDFVAWVGGHAHIDVCGVDSTYTNQVKIAIDTASVPQSVYSDTYRSTDTNEKSYDCFNLLSIDTYQKLIKFVRIGADMDSWMRKKDVMTIQYATSIANPISSPTVIKPTD